MKAAGVEASPKLETVQTQEAEVGDTSVTTGDSSSVLVFSAVDMGGLATGGIILLGVPLLLVSRRKNQYIRIASAAFDAIEYADNSEQEGGAVPVKAIKRLVQSSTPPNVVPWGLVERLTHAAELKHCWKEKDRK